MADRTVVDRIEDWQTGALLVFVAVLAGMVPGWLLRSVAPPYSGAIGFVGGVVVAFLALPTVLYGRRGSGCTDKRPPTDAVDMELTPDVVAAEREWVRDQAGSVVPIVNAVREDLGERFDTTVDLVDEAAYLAAVDDVFADGDLAVNVAAIVRLLRELDVTDDYPGFVVDELLGRELAGMLAGNQPLRLLGEATFHYADVATHGDSGEAAGADDLTAALAAGFQTRLPGWDWRDGASPFTVG